MRGIQLIRTLGALALVLAAYPHPAHAAQRTFVATSGSDANPCSRSLPCRTFGAALVQTTGPNGEIVALDSGGYGPVTITQTVTIVGAPGAHVAITASSGNAITVAAGASDDVVLRNLYVTGHIGTTNNGIVFLSGAALHVEHVVVNRFNDNGIVVRSSPSSHTVISDTIVRGTDFGISVEGGGNALITRTRAEGNFTFGVVASGGSRVLIRDSVAAGNGNSGFVVLQGATTGAEMSIEHSTASGTFTGVAAFGASAVIDVSNSTITYNGTGVSTATGGSIFSRVNNTLERNGTDGSFTGSITAK